MLPVFFARPGFEPLTLGTTASLSSFFHGVDFFEMISWLGTFFSTRTLKTGLAGSGFFSTTTGGGSDGGLALETWRRTTNASLTRNSRSGVSYRQ